MTALSPGGRRMLCEQHLLLGQAFPKGSVCFHQKWADGFLLHVRHRIVRDPSVPGPSGLPVTLLRQAMAGMGRAWRGGEKYFSCCD